MSGFFTSVGLASGVSEGTQKLGRFFSFPSTFTKSIQSVNIFTKTLWKIQQSSFLVHEELLGWLGNQDVRCKQ